MKSIDKSILPLLLREKEALSAGDVETIYRTYKQLGRNGMVDYLNGAKPNKAFASLLLSELDIDAQFWKDVHQSYISRNEKVLELLDRIFSSFHALGGKSLSVQENFGSVLSSGISIGCFASGDVDLYTKREENDLLIRALEKNDFIKIRRPDKNLRKTPAFTEFFNDRALEGKGYCINLMKTPISRDDFMLNQRRYENRLLHEWPKLENYKGTEICYFEPTALLYACSLHIASAHFFAAKPGLPLYCDVDRVIRHREIDWKRIAKWCNDDKVGLRVALVLDLSRYFMNTENPVALSEFSDVTSDCYINLRRRIINEEKYSLTESTGKLFRLYAEIASDNMKFYKSIINRIRG